MKPQKLSLEKNAEKYGGVPLLLKNLARIIFSIAGKKT